MNQSIDMVAKLMATENITVIKKAVSTASFDVKSRTLVLPIFKNMTPVIEEMLVCHEVGHALYTTPDMLLVDYKDYNLKDYINVVEDVRVEKLMKRKYPGIKKIMTEGYNQLNDQDFFGISKIKNVNQLNLIDRINMWFKVGFSSGVTFSESELEFITRAEKTETESDVIQLSIDIYEFSKQQLNQKEQKQPDEIEDSDGSDIQEINEPTDQDAQSQSTDQDTNEQVDTTFGYQSADTDESNDELESITSDSFTEHLNQSVDTSVDYNYLSLDTNYDPDMVIPYKTILSETEEHVEPYRYYGNITSENHTEEYNKFKTNALRTVNYLVKEFEMKKAATQYKRNQTSKSGSLDMKKIWSYQLNDDLFKRINITQDGKKHGMIFLVDWSGSMIDVLHDVIQQVTTLAMFCHRIKIPFQVLAFSSYYYSDDYINRRTMRRETYSDSENVLSNAVDTCHLLEFFSDKMTGKEFNDMAKRMFHTQEFIHRSNYELGGTPLNPALAYMTDHIGKFITQNAVERMSFITLTDGAGERLFTSNYITRYNNFLTDTKTKKHYPFMQYSADQQTDTLLNIIRDRYNIQPVGFYVANTMHRREIWSAMKNNGIEMDYNNYEFIKANVRKDGFAAVKTNGRAELFIVPSKSLKIQDEELDIKGKQSSRSIATQFSKTMEKRQLNRLLLNKFVSYVA